MCRDLSLHAIRLTRTRAARLLGTDLGSCVYMECICGLDEIMGYSVQRVGECRAEQLRLPPMFIWLGDKVDE